MRAGTAHALLVVYKRVLSPLLHSAVGAGALGSKGACRFQPTCSEYAAITLAEHGLVRGGAMAVGRLLRCHPLHRGGYDPVTARAPENRKAFSQPSDLRGGQVL